MEEVTKRLFIGALFLLIAIMLMGLDYNTLDPFLGLIAGVGILTFLVVGGFIFFYTLCKNAPDARRGY